MAAPVVSGVSGTLTHGQSVTISGSGFGTKASAAPSLWDTNDNIGAYSALSNGDSIPYGGSSPWQDSTTISYFDDVSGDQRSTLSDSCYRGYNATFYNRLAGYRLASVPSQAYISWWFKSSSEPPYSVSPPKFIRWQEYTNHTENTFTWAADLQFIYYRAGSCTCDPCGSGSTINWDGTTVSANTWHYMEVIWDSVGQTWDTRVDGVSTISGGVDYSCDFHPDYIFAIGLDSPVSWSADTWMDDIYIDGTWSRVMIGNASTYAASTHFEMQPPTAWSSSSITVTLNRGSFGASSTAYVYVVDSTGAVNSSGYSVTFGSGGDTTPPTISSATINTAGNTLTAAMSETVTVNDTGNVPTLTMSGGAVTATYVSGSGTASLVYSLSRTIESGETGHLDWDLGTDDVEDAAGNDLADVTDQAVTNNSTSNGSTSANVGVGLQGVGWK